MYVAETIKKQIIYGKTGDNKHGQIALMCWGASQFKGTENSLRFKVQGHLLKGYVDIKLNGSDLYDVKFYNTRMTLKKSYDDVFCDQLTELIDDTIERIV